MPSSIDKNDVDISKLFHWNNKYVLKVKDKEYNVYVRLLGDAEVNRARIYALRKSAELRAKLHDKNSDEYLAYLPQKEIITEDELVSGLLIMHTRTFTLDAVRNVRPELPIEPSSESSLEKKEKYQKEVDEFDIKRDKKYGDYIKEKTEAKEKEIRSKSKDDIYKDYINMITNQACETEMVMRYREMCSYFGTYKDKEFKNRLFGNFEEFNNMPTDVKEQLMDAYQLLEIDSETLKK